jgi:hypothetical protein
MDNKADGATWVRITILVAIIGCIGGLGAAMIGILPDILPIFRTATPSFIQGAILFQDNFDDGNADKWDGKQGIWEVIRDENGNYVYQGNANSSSWAYAIPRSASFTWQDYAIELKWRVVKISDQVDAEIADGQVTFRIRYDKSNGCSYYGIFFDTVNDFTSLARQGLNADCQWKGLAEKQYSFQSDQWYILRIETIGSLHKAYINGNLFLETEDSGVMQGAFEIDAAPGAIVQYDDIKVWALGK